MKIKILERELELKSKSDYYDKEQQSTSNF